MVRGIYANIFKLKAICFSSFFEDLCSVLDLRSIIVEHLVFEMHKEQVEWNLSLCLNLESLYKG